VIFAKNQKLTIWTTAAYGSLALPLSTIGLPLSIYLAPFYAGELGLPLAVLGLAMVIARMSDVVIDPFIGMASDNMRTRFGRRRIWIPLGIAVLMLGVWYLFNPSPPVDVIYFVVWISVVYLGFTLVQLPYQAWGGELTQDYHGRTRVASVRQAFGLLGLILATTLPAIVLQQKGATAGDVLHTLSLLMLVLLPVCGAIVFFFVPEPPPLATEKSISFLEGLKVVAKNGPFKAIVLALFLGYVAETFRITITLFFARDAIGVPNIGLIYVFYFITGLIAVPFWGWLAKRIGKHKALAFAFFIVVATNTAVFFLHYGQVGIFTAIFMAKGFCFGALELLPAALVADAVDVDTARSGARRQGLFFAFVTMTNKFGQAIGQGLSLMLLGAIGYKAAGGNGPEAIAHMKMLYGLGPALLLVPGILIMLRYRLTAQRHNRLAGAIGRREARQASATSMPS
jgi:glycoside/pentoside/hexuronide:cation symporter, GPH family